MSAEFRDTNENTAFSEGASSEGNNNITPQTSINYDQSPETSSRTCLNTLHQCIQPPERYRANTAIAITPYQSSIHKCSVNINSEPLHDYLQDNPLHSAVAHLQEQTHILNDENGSQPELDPFSYLMAGENDTLSFSQMLKDTDRPKFEAAMEKEINALVENNLFDIHSPS